MEDFLLLVLAISVVAIVFRLSQLSARIKQLEAQQQRAPAPPPPQPYPAPPASRPATVAPAAASVPAIAHAPSPASAPYRAPYIPPPPPSENSATQPATPRSAPLPAFAAAAPREPKPHVSLEARLGQNWLNKLGITALVIGLALGLGKIITTLGSLGKDAIGFGLALALLCLGIFLERRPAYKLFARVLIGGGWALLFFLSFALYHVPLLRVLHSEATGLMLMFLVATGMVVHSLRYHSQTVTTFAFLLAFVTVGLSEVTLFSLVAGAILTGGLAFLVYRERWYALGLAGLIGVYLNHFLWLHRVLPDGGLAYLHQHGHTFPEFLPSALLLLAYWLIFRLIYVLRPPLPGPQHGLEQTLATASALLNAAGLLGLLKYQSSHPEWAFYGLTALGLAELALSLIARGGLRSDAESQPNRIAFISLSTLASLFLLAAVPFRFQGGSWTLFWLLEAEALYLTGVRIPERIFRRLGILASLITGVAALSARPDAPYVGVFMRPFGLNAHTAHLPSHCILLLTTALVLWFNAEFTTHRWPFITTSGFDRLTLRISSYLAAFVLFIDCTIAVPLFIPHHAWLTGSLVAISWLIIALVLGLLTDRITSSKPLIDLATQSDLFGLLTVLTIFISLLNQHGTAHLHRSTLLANAAIAALFYLATHRRTRSYLLPSTAIAPTYSWIAAAFIALQLWYHLEPVSVAVAWGIFGLILFELNYLLRKQYLRPQAYALLAAAFVRIFFANLSLPGHTSLYTVLPLVAAFAWVYERTHTDATTSHLDNIAAQLFAWCSLIAAGTLIYFELRPSWVALAWTLLAIALLALACALKRTIFIAQSLVVLFIVALRGIFFHLFSPTPLAATFTTSRPFTITLTSALLFAALPLAFYLRRNFTGDDLGAPCLASGTWVGGPALLALLHHPEQPFFFVPLTLFTLLFYVQFHGGRITIAWVALGLATFLFALTVKERSYRLSGLSLLLLGVAKVLAWDVWHVSPTDRYLTLIIMGASLLLVSFLYSRYRETLLNFL